MEQITDDSDTAWTPYNSPAELKDVVRGFINRMEQKEVKAIEDACMLFAPTGAFQEHAISNGWPEEYMNLADRFDKVHEWIKRYGRL